MNPGGLYLWMKCASATNRRKRRRRGRSRRGQVAYQPEWFEKGSQELNTLIAACNINGMMVDACVVTHDNCDRESFITYVRDGLAKVLQPFPGMYAHL